MAQPDLSEKIISVLEQHSGRTAREIAVELDEDKSLVNSVLYGQLRGKVERDDHYRWWIAGSRSVGQKQKSEPDDANTPLSQLCRYFLSCIDQESSVDASAYASNRYGEPDYMELPAHPLTSDYDPFLEERARSIWGKVQAQRNNVLCLGHPVLVSWIRLPNRNHFAVVEPVFLHFISADNGQPVIDDAPPSINHKFLARLSGNTRSILEQSIELAEELGLTRHLAELPEYDDVLARIRELHPEWPWLDEPDPYRLTDEPPLSEAAQDGIYNRAILIPLERQNYTQGLETELQALRKATKEQYGQSALGRWIHVTKSIPEEPLDSEVLLEVAPLNSEQRTAVHSALAAPLTVVTGPPGTGKSQVVSAILVNAAWRQMSVLFSSKNSKAVDVVETRVNALGRRPVLLRTGKKEHYSELSDYLTQLLSQSSTGEDISKFNAELEHYKQLLSRIQSLDQQLDTIVHQRNRVDELDRIVDGWRHVLTPDQISTLKSWDLEKIDGVIKEFRFVLDGCWKEKAALLFQLFWRWVKKGRIDQLRRWQKEHTSAFGEAGVLLPQVLEESDPNLPEWEEVYEFGKERVRQARAWQELITQLKRLSSEPALEDVSRQRASMIPELEATSRKLWDLWLSVQPARLTNEQRQDLGRFNTLLRMMGSGSNIGKTAREFHRLFPNVTRQLSCWAVTALSARNRVPLDPGFFDLLIIDEASQCDIASALPLLYRAKRAVIIGDPQQLRHITSITTSMDEQLLESHELVPDHIEWSYSENSLFDLASTRVSASTLIALRDHHRSHADIIEFSNRNFYDGRLRVATHYDRLIRPGLKGPAVRWIDVKGQLLRPQNGGAINKREARAVVDELARLVIEQRYAGTVGVVTPFRAHANLINRFVAENDSLQQRLNEHDFLCDVVHSFQGDEKDIMIFSPVISSGTTRGARWFMGTSSNLFNVAVTRARAALIVVGDRNAANNEDIKYLRQFSSYVYELDKRTEVDKRPEIPDLGPEYPTVSQPEIVSDWERYFYKKLYQAGFRPVPQVPVEKYILDFALYDGDRRLNIEVDGETYHRAWDGELCRRDQMRNLRMIELGWDVQRFWVYQLREQIDWCIDKVRGWVELKQ